ncbi:MAG: ABC transporter permease [Lachnospiraceae bacterium]|nr:ABC transporter permease [Lachnospiraceae bacterium]
MYQLTKIHFTRIIRFKALWVYLLGMLAMTINSGLQLVNAPSGDFFSEEYSGLKFPIYIMQGQIVLVEPLFMGLIAAYLVNYEKSTGMLKQSILHGKTKTQLINSKISVLMLTSLIFVFIFFISSILIGKIIWRDISVIEVIKECASQYLLVMVPLITLSFGLVLMTLYTTKMAFTIGIVLFLVLLDSLLNQFFVPAISNVSFMYYIYAYSAYNSIPIEPWMISRGITICIISAITFYALILHRVHRMEFR